MTRPLSRFILAAVACGGAAYSQAASVQPAFEVASVKPYDPASAARFSMQGGPGTGDPGRFTCRNCSLRSLVVTAYDVKDYQISSGVWSAALQQRYDIAAKVPDGTSKEHFQLMLQNLLANRFKLVLHHQNQEMTVYNLVAGKNGPKLTPSPHSASPVDTEPAGRPAGTLDNDGFPVPPPGFVTTVELINRDRRMGATSVPVTKLVSMLSTLLAKPVYDGTGLKGEYDFKLAWSPDLPGEPRRLQDGSLAPAAPDADSGPTIFAALQDQLGLRLDPTKSPVDVLVIDHVEKVPTEN